jgi:16S rRNA processing protein RimM
VDGNLVVVGRVAGLYGVKGWIKVISYTEPRKNILDYRPWHLEQDGVIEEAGSVTGRIQGKGLVANLAGIEDRDAAAGLIGANILVNRDLFAQPESDEYYWRDLVGLKVVTTEGVNLGSVESLLETGANDVLVLQGERRRLIPFVVDDIVKRVDLDAAKIIVDWEPEF